MNPVSETLKGMQGLWDKSQAAYDTMFGGVKVDGGTYLAKLTQCYLRVSKAGNPYIGREFTILEGENEGAKVNDNLMLTTENGPVFVRRFIDQAGYEQPKASKDLEALILAIHKAGLEFQIQVKHNGDFTNVSLLKNLSETPSPTDDAVEENTGVDALDQDDADEAFRQSLLVFARAQDIKVSDDDTVEEIVAEMKRWTFEEVNLEAEELKLLEDAGLADCIERKPAPAPVKDKAPAPAKPAPAKAAPAPARKGPPAPARKR